MKMKFWKRERGFSVAEMITAIAVFAVLAFVLIFSILGVREETRDTQRKSDVQQYQLAFRLQKDLTGSYPDVPKGELLGDGFGPAEGELQSFLGGVIKDPIEDSDHNYYFDSSYTCDGVKGPVVIVETMERSKNANYRGVCSDDVEYLDEDTGTGFVPDPDKAFIVILGEPYYGVDIPETPERSCGLYASKTTINEGDSSRLTWDTDFPYVDSMSIDPKIGSVDPDGSEIVTPDVTTTYTLTVSGRESPSGYSSEVTCKNTITVLK
jgi:type II secretory pathway pseudopilin PulG